MNDYFIRCKMQDKSRLLMLSQILGILKTSEDDSGQYVPTNPAWVWVPIGALYQPSEVDPEVFEPRRAPDNSIWWHANLRLTMDLLEHAQAVYEANPSPELAQGLQAISDFFYTDANGRATRPLQLAVDFA
jgi:hypothetical protein